MHLFNPSDAADTQIQVSLYDGAGERVSSDRPSSGSARDDLPRVFGTFFAVELSDFLGGVHPGRGHRRGGGGA